ncbi:DNA polymerase III subunit delta [Agaricicola taiwanensis]|uniref:DNA-directed DNA polymerase n=1 Tax=Agaricicola taiwanensis TaxID=591372 RepID=A0A8J2VK56_9RHOB|nr:DNA polymerase III subunit delta [Agaricicola taiwanensis]GGE28759.1 DNA polymerase III subunit delta [Agaricicola taiwanensis]
MVAIKAAAVDAFLSRPDPKAACILVYGPDVGLVHERARHLATAGLSNPDDPFALVRLDGDVIAGDPGRLVDEATTSALFGGERSVWIRLGSRSIAPAIEALLSGPAPTARVVVEAGDLKKTAPVRAICERNPRAAALPCYADSDAAIGRLIDDEISKANLTISPDARRHLVELLGADRIGSRSEIEKLCLYALDRGRIEVADIDLMIADSGASAMDEAVDAAFAGDVAGLEQILLSLSGSGIPVQAVLGSSLRHGQQLHKARLTVERGTPAHAVIESDWRRLHFSRKAKVERALSAWPSEKLETALVRLSDAVLESRRAGAFGDTVAARVLASIAAEAKPRGRTSR